MKDEPRAAGPPDEDLEDFFENSLNGYAFAAPDGTIARANCRLAAWLGTTPAELAGRRFSDCLTIGGKILYETHLAPLLRMQGEFGEVALELRGAEGTRLPVFVNAWERRDSEGNPISLRLTLFKGTDRLLYERNLRQARDLAEISLNDERMTSTLREQFIAVLGHDLRNPLTAITTGANFLGQVTPLTDKGAQLVEVIRNSASRMGELIDDVMDFARGRLGGGIALALVEIELEPVLAHVIEELRTARPGRLIESDFDLPQPVVCDAGRLSQLVSNLVANALTHGQSDGTVRVRAASSAGLFELSVSNGGIPIPPATLGKLFQPFTRDEERPSQQGLGLGLYIASQIARAHGGELHAQSSEEETRMTLRMPRDAGSVHPG